MKTFILSCLFAVSNFALPVFAQDYDINQNIAESTQFESEPNPDFIPPRYTVERVICQSHNNRYAQCRVYYGSPFDVILVKQYPGSACIKGRTFGLTRYAAMWVDHNCRGDFKVLTRL